MFLNGGLCPALQYSIRPCFRSFMQMNMVTSRKGTKNKRVTQITQIQTCN